MAKFRFYRAEVWYVAAYIEADTEEEAVNILLHEGTGEADVDMSDKELDEILPYNEAPFLHSLDRADVVQCMKIECPTHPHD